MTKKKEARQIRIQKILLERTKVKISDLAKELNVTPETLRNDLNEMENLSLLVREHGYARVISSSFETPLTMRNRENPEDKLGILDLQLDVNDNEKVDVEIQLLKKDNFKNRLIYYMSKLIAKQMKRGFKYDELKRVVIVAIIDFELEETKDIKDVVTVWNMDGEDKTR